jgi:hypothetical protein
VVRKFTGVVKDQTLVAGESAGVGKDQALVTGEVTVVASAPVARLIRPCGVEPCGVSVGSVMSVVSRGFVCGSGWLMS